MVLENPDNMKFIENMKDIDFEDYREIILPDIYEELLYLKRRDNRNGKDEDDFLIVVNSFLDDLKHAIEHRKGHLVLNNKNGRVNEKIVQAYIGNFADAYFKGSKIVADREIDTGRGSIDMKISAGRNEACLIEIKLSNHVRVADGYQYQLPTYMLAEGIKYGYYILICFTLEDYKKELVFDSMEHLPESIEIFARKINASGNLKSASKVANAEEMGFE